MPRQAVLTRHERRVLRRIRAALGLGFVTLTLLLAAALASFAFASLPEKPATEIVADGDVLRIMIDGKEVARFAADGLHVEGDLSYSGNISDIGYGSQEQAR